MKSRQPITTRTRSGEIARPVSCAIPVATVTARDSGAVVEAVEEGAEEVVEEVVEVSGVVVAVASTTGRSVDCVVAVATAVVVVLAAVVVGTFDASARADVAASSPTTSVSPRRQAVRARRKGWSRCMAVIVAFRHASFRPRAEKSSR